MLPESELQILMKSSEFILNFKLLLDDEMLFNTFGASINFIDQSCTLEHILAKLIVLLINTLLTSKPLERLTNNFFSNSWISLNEYFLNINFL
jgi:hypothetical protein